MIRAMFGLFLCLALCAKPAAADEDARSIVFGQLELVKGVPFSWKVVFRNIDTGATETVRLEPREATSVLYDFAAPLPPGKYHLYRLTAPRVDWENQITDASQYFELKQGAVLYLGSWKVKLGGSMKTTYSVKYDVNEVGLFSKANPGIDTSRFAIGVLGKPPVPLTTK